MNKIQTNFIERERGTEYIPDQMPQMALASPINTLPNRPWNFLECSNGGPHHGTFWKVLEVGPI